jgi:hypothetical protein
VQHLSWYLFLQGGGHAMVYDCAGKRRHSVVRTRFTLEETDKKMHELKNKKSDAEDGG